VCWAIPFFHCWQTCEDRATSLGSSHAKARFKSAGSKIVVVLAAVGAAACVAHCLARFFVGLLIAAAEVSVVAAMEPRRFLASVLMMIESIQRRIMALIARNWLLATVATINERKF